MRTKLKGVICTRARLADGREVAYWYAWRGGPRLPGTPGSPEFMAAYYAAVTAKRPPPVGLLRSVFDGFQDSAEFANLADRTRIDYRKQLRKIDVEFGEFPIDGLKDRRARGEFLAWRDRLAVKSRRNADYAFTILARTLAWGVDRGLLEVNPCKEAGRLYRATRRDKVWSEDDEARFLAVAPKRLQLALLLALWTGQRQGDLLRLTWSAYDGQCLRLEQGKTGARVLIPAGAPLKQALDEAGIDRQAVTILVNEAGRPWTSDGFRTSWRKACQKAGITGLTFHDLRGTAVTRLALAGCEVPEIATITGHALKDVGAILDSHYLNRDAQLAYSAIRKLETRTVLQNELQNAPSGSSTDRQIL